MKFTKMHTQGNDYICVEGDWGREKDIKYVVQHLCDRHRGIGADGLILGMPSSLADFRMRIFNSDGTEAEMCGNGIRCFAKFLYDKKKTKKLTLEIETMSGVHTVWLKTDQGQVNQVKVDMGYPRLNAHSIPMISTRDMVLKELILLDQESIEITGVSMGNPHAVIFVSHIESCPVERYGKLLESHPKFPKRVNIEFCQVKNREEIFVKVWERGVGETSSCGTGACAAVVASILSEEVERKVTVHQKGGDLEVEWEKSTNKIYLTGDTYRVFEGELAWI